MKDYFLRNEALIKGYKNLFLLSINKNRNNHHKEDCIEVIVVD